MHTFQQNNKIVLADEYLVTIDTMGIEDDKEGVKYKDRSILSKHAKDCWELYTVKLHEVRFLTKNGFAIQNFNAHSKEDRRIKYEYIYIYPG